MGLAQGPDGSLYVSESKNGKIWRIIFNGDRLKFGKEELDQMESLKQKSYLRVPDKKQDLNLTN
jgi:sugar lactone lactonase YvrE